MGEGNNPIGEGSTRWYDRLFNPLSVGQQVKFDSVKQKENYRNASIAIGVLTAGTVHAAYGTIKVLKYGVTRLGHALFSPPPAFKRGELTEDVLFGFKRPDSVDQHTNQLTIKELWDKTSPQFHRAYEARQIDEQDKDHIAAIHGELIKFQTVWITPLRCKPARDLAVQIKDVNTRERMINLIEGYETATDTRNVETQQRYFQAQRSLLEDAYLTRDVATLRQNANTILENPDADPYLKQEATQILGALGKAKRGQANSDFFLAAQAFIERRKHE